MGQKYCVSHPNAPSVSHCHQCHKPLCKSCVMVTPAGSFCSSECSIIYKEMKAKLGGGGRKKGGNAAKVLMFVVLLAVAGVLVIHLMARGKDSDHPLKKLDLLGKYLDRPE